MDWLSLSGEGYVPSMYKKYKRIVSPMGSVIAAHLKLGELLNNRCTFYIFIINNFILSC